MRVPGPAWFRIDATRQYAAQQGYVTARNANLLYPAIGAPQSGSPEVVFTINSATINPSTAYTRLGSGRITTVAAGAGPHLSFSDAPPFNSPCWGDYSFAQPDPDGYGVRLATEYIPLAADQDPMDNWGTYVFQVTGPNQAQYRHEWRMVQVFPAWNHAAFSSKSSLLAQLSWDCSNRPQSSGGIHARPCRRLRDRVVSSAEWAGLWRTPD